jgi:hypothetical protein
VLAPSKLGASITGNLFLVIREFLISDQGIFLSLDENDEAGPGSLLQPFNTGFP